MKTFAVETSYLQPVFTATCSLKNCPAILGKTSWTKQLPLRQTTTLLFHCWVPNTCGQHPTQSFSLPLSTDKIQLLQYPHPWEATVHSRHSFPFPSEPFWRGPQTLNSCHWGTHGCHSLTAPSKLGLPGCVSQSPGRISHLCPCHLILDKWVASKACNHREAEKLMHGKRAMTLPPVMAYCYVPILYSVPREPAIDTLCKSTKVIKEDQRCRLLWHHQHGVSTQMKELVKKCPVHVRMRLTHHQ